ncbi:Hypothetical predicted protein, partial [Prunus dulcis]
MGRSFSLKQPLARPFHKPSLSQLPFSSLQHHLHCAVFVTKLAIHVTDLGIEFIEVVISLASRSLKSPSSRGHLHDLLNLLHRVCQEPPSLLSSRLRLLFLSSSTYSSLNLRDLQATLTGGGYRLDVSGVITILLAIVIGFKSGDFR